MYKGQVNQSEYTFPGVDHYTESRTFHCSEMVEIYWHGKWRAATTCKMTASALYVRHNGIVSRVDMTRIQLNVPCFDKVRSLKEKSEGWECDEVLVEEMEAAVDQAEQDRKNAIEEKEKAERIARRNRNAP